MLYQMLRASGTEHPSLNWQLTCLPAAPLVATVLANFLSYDPVPSDMSDGHAAASAKAYLQATASCPR
jgi:hypothetical protein